MTPKLEHEAKEALRESLKAIERLQHENEVLAIKARAFDTFAGLVASMMPNRVSSGGDPNPVWILRKLIAEIAVAENEEAAQAKAKAEAAGGA